MLCKTIRLQPFVGKSKGMIIHLIHIADSFGNGSGLF